MIGTQKTIIVNNVYNMMKQGRLKVPSYQHNYIWSARQQERYPQEQCHAHLLFASAIMG